MAEHTRLLDACETCTVVGGACSEDELVDDVNLYDEFFERDDDEEDDE
jgi:hypothetical protein